MEVDYPYAATESSDRRGSTTPPTKVIVSPDDAFDLDQVASNYEGRAKIDYLMSIAQISPSLAGQALTLALHELKRSTLDVPLYEQAFHQYRQHVLSIESGEMMDPLAVQWWQGVQRGATPEETMDREWCDKSNREAGSGLEKLEVELKGYSTNLLKESIRMGHRDLARFQYKIGQLQAAQHSYIKSREFCLTSQHLLEMSLGVTEVALALSNYPFVRNWAAKAEAALESIHSNASAQNAKQKPQVNLPGMIAPQQDPAEVAREKERQATQEKLNVAVGVSYLGQGVFDKAARSFTSGGKEALNSVQGHFIPPADIALYATLTGLATFTRNELRTRLLENGDLRPMLDLEPYLRDIIRAFHTSNFKEGLDGLEKYSTRQKLDPHLAPHLPALLYQIRSRALLVYFAPFASVSLSRMAAAFGWSETVLQSAVVELIGQGKMKARVDSQAKVLVAKQTDARIEAFRHALERGEKMQRSQHAAQLRVKLIQADVVVKAPKGQPSQQHQQVAAAHAEAA